MKKIRIVAVISAIVLAISVYIYLQGLQKPPVEAPKSKVVLAAVAIKAGDVIKADMVMVATLPSEAVLTDAAKSIDEVVGRISDRNTEAGEQLLVTRFLQLGSSDGGLSYVVQSGMRAITIQVDSTNGIAGMIKPHNRVDLLITIGLAIPTATPKATATPEPTPTPSNASALSKATPAPSASPSEPPAKQYSVVVMQNILVLAVGQAMDSQKNDGKDAAAGANTITFQVTPEQAQKLSLAVSLAGNIRLTLRSPLDDGMTDLKPIDATVFYK